jgi:RND family efflux transporter MFP subunit
LAAELDARIADLKLATSYFDTLSLVLTHTLAESAHPQASIDGYQASASGARSAVAGALSSVTGAKTAFAAARSAAAAAANQSSADAGAVTTASAGVKQALGALQGAKARLANTIVYSPINGTIISLPVSTGDYVGMGSPVATVSNNAALEIVTYINEDDARTVAVGGTVHIEGGISGVITRIAPALDPITKKIEVRIGISDSSSLTNGSTVRVDLDRAATPKQSSTILLPLSAIKILPDSAGVFTVATSGALVLNPVGLGGVSGDKVVIASGVTADMTIVTDARGLKAGDIVTVQTR